MSGGEFLLRMSGYILAGWLAWRTALRIAPAWLRQGEGPLWLIATGMPVVAALSVLVTGDNVMWVQAVRFHARSDDGIHWLLVGTLAALCSYSALRIALGGTRKSTSIWRSFFLGVGVLPDGTILRHLHRTIKLAVVGTLVLATAAGCVLHALQVDGIFPIVWGLGTAGIMCMWLAFVHPVSPWRPVSQAAAGNETEKLPPPILVRAAPLLRWLGARGPVRVDISRSSGAADSAGLFVFQRDAITSAKLAVTVALTGPVGSGRSTLAFLMAIQHVMGKGATALFVVSSTERALELQRVMVHAQELWIDAGILTSGLGVDVADADVWISTPEQVATHLDLRAGGRDDGQQKFLNRLAFVCFDDIEDFSGPGMIEQRYLLFRLSAIVGFERELKVVFVGCLADAPMREASAHIAATDAIALVSGWHGGLGPSRPIQRFLFGLGTVEWPRFDSPAGMPALQFGIDHYAKSSNEAEMAFAAHLQTGVQRTVNLGLSGRDASKVSADDVWAIRVTGTNACELLVRGRQYFAQDGEPALEILLFGDDPVSRWLEFNWHAATSSWPSDLRPDRYPRVLASLPGHGLRARGARVLARRHLRAAMADGPQAADRLKHVFSPGVVDELLAELGQKAVWTKIWRPAELTGPGHVVSEAVHFEAGRGGGVAEDEPQVELHAPSVGRTLRMPARIVNYEAPIGCTVALEGRRYEVGSDERRGGLYRILSPVEDARQTAAIRTLRFTIEESRGTKDEIRFGGTRTVASQRVKVRVHVKQEGVHTFKQSIELGKVQVRRERSVTFPTPILDETLLTEAWVIELAGATEVTLHTLTHVVRDSLDYFFIGASAYLGVSGQMELGGKPALVFYERAVGGHGCLETVNATDDLGCILRIAYSLLEQCPGRKADDATHACGICCRSVACTLEKHNDLLDAVATGNWLREYLYK
jgi:hypothetical protein